MHNDDDAIRDIKEAIGPPNMLLAVKLSVEEKTEKRLILTNEKRSKVLLYVFAVIPFVVFFALNVFAWLDGYSIQEAWKLLAFLLPVFVIAAAILPMVAFLAAPVHRYDFDAGKDTFTAVSGNLSAQNRRQDFKLSDCRGVYIDTRRERLPKLGYASCTVLAVIFGTGIVRIYLLDQAQQAAEYGEWIQRAVAEAQRGSG